MKAMQLFGLVDPNPHPSLHPDGPNITWVSDRRGFNAVNLIK